MRFGAFVRKGNITCHLMHAFQKTKFAREMAGGSSA